MNPFSAVKYILFATEILMAIKRNLFLFILIYTGRQHAMPEDVSGGRSRVPLLH